MVGGVGLWWVVVVVREKVRKNDTSVKMSASEVFIFCKGGFDEERPLSRKKIHHLQSVKKMANLCPATGHINYTNVSLCSRNMMKIPENIIDCIIVSAIYEWQSCSASVTYILGWFMARGY